MIPLVYHRAYNFSVFGLERLHPFDGRKYQRIHDALIARGLRRREDFARPCAVSRADLERVHALDYLRTLQRPSELARILEIPVAGRLPGWLLNWRVLHPMRLAAGGTLLAARKALEVGLAINLGGGFHHAAAHGGGGFCVYADLPIAAKILRDEGRIDRVLVIDLDAHQGNGTAAVFHDWPWAAILDLYEDDLFPFPKPPEDVPIPVPAGLSGSEYLDLVQRHVPRALETYRPNLVLYNAGSDPYEGDPLAFFRLSREDLVERDLLVVTLVRERGIPLAMALSGGYSRDSWRIHADSIEALSTRFDAVTPSR